jgi:hypothetical protein
MKRLAAIILFAHSFSQVSAAHPVCRVGGALRNDIAATDCKEAQETGCIRRKLTDAQYMACLRANKKARSEGVCREYGQRMVALASEASALNCAFLKHGSWQDPQAYWERECKSGDGRMDYNSAALKRQLDKCKIGSSGAAGNNVDAEAAIKAAGAEVPGALKATAAANNMVYKTNSGDDTSTNTVCSMRAGDSAVVIESGPGKWVRLAEISGGCGGKSGWSWNDSIGVQVPSAAKNAPSDASAQLQKKLQIYMDANAKAGAAASNVLKKKMETENDTIKNMR